MGALNMPGVCVVMGYTRVVCTVPVKETGTQYWGELRPTAAQRA